MKQIHQSTASESTTRQRSRWTQHDKHDTLNQCWLKFGQRRGRWPNSKTTSIQRLTFLCFVSILCPTGAGPRVVVSTAAFYARVHGSFPGLGGLKETKMFLPHPFVKLSIVGRLCDREVACSASDLQGLNFESCVWRAVSSHSFHHPHEVLLAQFSLYVHKSGLKPDSFHFSMSHT